MRDALRAAVTAAGVAAVGATSIASADDYSLISAPFGTGSYVLGGALEEIMRAHHDTIRVSHSESPGFVFNLNQLDRDHDLRESMIIGTGRGVAYLAEEGQEPFEEPVESVMPLANYFVTVIWMATLDTDVESVEDLRDSRVALGNRTQINYAVEPEALLRVGADLGDEVRIEYLGLTEAVAAVLDGQADATIMGGFAGEDDFQLSPHAQEFLAANRSNTRFLEWGEDVVQRTVDETGIPLAHFTLEDGMLPAFQDGDMAVAADTSTWGVHPDFPEEAAYEITKVLIEQVDKFSEYHALGELMHPDGLVFGWDPEEFHPGARRAYQEAGILD